MKNISRVIALWLTACATFCNAQAIEINARVRTAQSNQTTQLTAALRKHQLAPTTVHIFIRAFKSEKKLEIWVRSAKQNNATFSLFRTYDVCAASGALGFKHQEGDEQVPEGVYFIDRYNPYSKFYLSLGLNYPNLADQRRQPRANRQGGDIFIHGDCKSIGCLAMTDDKIEEIYLLAMWAFQNGQKRVPVHIFPTHLTNARLTTISKAAPTYKLFWQSLQPVYQYFETNKKIPVIEINASGTYIVKP